MKTPEEIKRGLECGNCDGCPYARWDEKTGQFADHHCEFVETDALAYIQQLEQDNAQKDEHIRQLEREKEALINIVKACRYCKYFSITRCTRPSKGIRLNGDCFEWRGVEEEANEAERSN